MDYQHRSLAQGGWFKLSLMEQLGNIGSEISRAKNWREKNPQLYRNTLERAFELLDLTIADPRWRRRLKEIVRTREILGDIYVTGGSEYKVSLEDLDKYFFWFALAARRNR